MIRSKNIFISYASDDLAKKKALELTLALQEQALVEEKIEQIEEEVSLQTFQVIDLSSIFPNRHSVTINAADVLPIIEEFAFCYEADFRRVGKASLGYISNPIDFWAFLDLKRKRKRLRRKIKALRSINHISGENQNNCQRRFLKLQSVRINDKSGENINELFMAA